MTLSYCGAVLFEKGFNLNLFESFNFLIYYLSFSVIALAIGILIREHTMQCRFFYFNKFPIRLIFPLIIATLAILVLVMPIVNLIPMNDQIVQWFTKYSTDTSIAQMATVIFVAPLVEELIFRGIILDGLLKKYSPVFAIFFSGLLFALAHFNPWQIVTAFALGVFSGWMYYKTKSLLPCILIHFTANFTAYLLQYKISVDISLIEGSDPGVISLKLIFPFFILILVLFFALMNLDKSIKSPFLKEDK
ncbi:CPBP family intramembrane metalloprotease [Puteibacter caeruleilacunae]|nr:CPBP family intramembrane metalloprotease [Puteibacter caeruleilacunae]